MKKTSYTWGDQAWSKLLPQVPQSFALVAPTDLMLPDTVIDGYDPSEWPGYRCAWLIHWAIARDTATVKVVKPQEWRIDVGRGPESPEALLLPDELLIQALKDIALRPAVYSQRAAYILLEQPGSWRASARELIRHTQSAETERFSKYNPVYRSSLFRVPEEFRDRVRS